jgi:hypothetical protein
MHQVIARENMAGNMSCFVHIKCTYLGQPFCHQQYSFRRKICIVFLFNHKFTTPSEHACAYVRLTPAYRRTWLWLIMYILFLQAMTKTRGWHYWVVTWCYLRAPRSRWLPSRQGRLLLLVEVYEFHSVCIDVLYLVHLCNVSL